MVDDPGVAAALARGDLHRVIVLSKHARFRMREHGFTLDDICDVLQSPDVTRPAPPQHGTPSRCLIYERHLTSGRTLKVYLERGSDPPKVVTGRLV